MNAPRQLEVSGLLADTEAHLVDALNLTPIVLPTSLAHAEAASKHGPARVKARAYRGSRIAYARFVWVNAGASLEIGNALCVPHPKFALPVLGLDVVQTNPARPTLFVEDLSPTTAMKKHAHVERGLTAAQQAVASLPSAGALPAWCAAHVSPLPLFVRVGGDEGAPVKRAHDLLLNAFVHALQAASPDPELEGEASAATEAYLRSHREDDPGLGLMGKMFGEPFGSRFVSSIMFPSLHELPA